ncbi:T9SS type A sorting domain-containing protein [Flavobacterium psychrophilum]|uniref:T9SS type A sorting domain-containing protein n=2 Tax=Flavobacterium psychrophilum TaxID=96345 RepID=UPI000B6CA8D0|nr:T9SS type A sorting domain-containing protein [Flavobacterium psychrophilum]ELM3643165.1 T9SS type A sorting domain-containing protein [Flavobacterium psychrophilum]ELY2010812.1 T9SS type A sorting domain-containing protein [Flavobacterium psychrophilum]OUD27968.1 hypothetical protein FPG92_05815 [Flavobacterium psychrophilum]
MATAQQEINTSFKTQMNTTFGNLDKNRVPHGILLDYGMEFTNVPRYNGTLTDSTYTDMTAMSQIYKTLLTSRIRDVSTGFVTPTDYDNRWKNNRSTDFVAIGGLYFKYSQVADNAVATNKITVTNSIAYDKFIGGIWQNPYQEFQTFAMTPAIKKYDGLNMQVRIPSALFYSNYQSIVQSIQIDFGNGAGYVTVPFDQNFAVNYTTEGVKVWKYKLNLTNGTSLHNQSRIKVGQGLNTIPYGKEVMSAMATSTTSTATLYSQTITGTKLYAGATATVKLTIDLGAGHSQITKPLIVAEGFDLGVVFSPENANGQYMYSDFRRTINQSGSIELRNLIYENYKQYDIIYVDWNNGIDYMQRNAFALEEVIKWVNTVKVGTEKNVILGQSMGGVIARYALADMEQTGLDHKTRLFVSHDAPQQGANIPVSIQFMYRHLTNQYIQTNTTLFGGIVTVPILENNFGVSNYLSVLDAPASRQLLSNFSNLNYGIDNSIHTSFYDELKAKGLANSGGYPINCRNIAISNGAECGNGQGFNPSDDLVNYNWNKGLTFGGDLLSMVYLPLGGVIGGLFLDNDFFGVGLVGLIPGKSTYSVEFNAKAMPYGSGNQIYKGRISYTKKILWIGPKITVNITNVQKSQPAGILPLDTYGGGFYSTSIIAGSLTVPNLYVRDKFNFIPTTSALDIGKKSVVLQDTDYKMAYVGARPPVAPKNSPFANFSTDFEKYNPNASNKTHISFNSRNGEWLAKELNIAPITTNCSYMCASTQITGVSNFCTSATYTAPSGGTFNNWTITQGSNLVTLTGNGTPNITLTDLPNASGAVTLSLTMGDDWAKCGNITLTKTVWVGKPSFYLDYRYFEPQPVKSKFCAVSDVPNYTLAQQGVTNVVYTTSNNVPISNWGGPYCFRETNLFCVNATATNTCGTTTITYECDFRKANANTNFYTIYPNPSNNIVNIDLKDQENQPEKRATITGELFDMMGQSKSKVEISNNKATFSVRGLNKGIYVLKIHINDKVESHQIAVE